jgi:hypothetical protein
MVIALSLTLKTLIKEDSLLGEAMSPIAFASEPQERVGTPANCLNCWRGLKKFLGGDTTFLHQAIDQK